MVEETEEEMRLSFEIVVILKLQPWLLFSTNTRYKVSTDIDVPVCSVSLVSDLH